MSDVFGVLMESGCLIMCCLYVGGVHKHVSDE